MSDAPGVPAAAADNLLILDDDELVGTLVEAVGRRAGLGTRRMLNHADFFAAVTAAPPTHVVLDLTMPGMSGEDVLRQLAAVQCRARVIVCSGAEPERLSAAAALAGALGLRYAGTLHKPFSLGALRTLLAHP